MDEQAVEYVGFDRQGIFLGRMWRTRLKGRWFVVLRKMPPHVPSMRSFSDQDAAEEFLRQSGATTIKPEGRYT